MQCIHYGNDHFDKSWMLSIKNDVNFTKPFGGLWASRTDTKFGWSDYCRLNGLQSYLEKCFIFGIDDSARILRIKSTRDLDNLPKLGNSGFGNVWVSLDFEKMARYYDVIEVVVSEDEVLRRQLYGWDCDSILVTNPDIIKLIGGV